MCVQCALRCIVEFVQIKDLDLADFSTGDKLPKVVTVKNGTPELS